MMRTHGSPHRIGRALVVSLALVANLIAAGVPVLHAWAHDAHSTHHAERGQGVLVTAPVEVDHPHDQAHPLALHDECLLVHRTALNLALALPATRLEIESFVTDDSPAFHPVSPVASRAPPSADHARAPPLA